MKRIIIVGGFALLGWTMLNVWFASRPEAKKVRPPISHSSHKPLPPAMPAALMKIDPPTLALESQPLPLAETRPSEIRPQPAAPKPAAVTVQTPPKATNTPKPGKPPRRDPIARIALLEVGFNPLAEEYWLSAINDPSLSGPEREDLIEDLNEEGFADPKNLTFEDLPLILSRLQVIETYAPFAMDEVNAAAFQEAYKDLVNMAAKVTNP